MFGAAAPPFSAQTLATMMSMGSGPLGLFQPPAPPKVLSPEVNLLSLIQEASKLPPVFPSLQDLFLQNTIFQLLQAQASVNAKIPSPPPPVPVTSEPPMLTVIPSKSPVDALSRKRPSSSSSRKTADECEATPVPKRSKQMRKLASEDAETNSPVSGMHIKDMSEVSADDIAKAAELDETASFVVVSEETRRKLAEIPDVIKSTNCALCKVKFEDVIHLARHKCPRIVHEEYKCSECEKVFSCPANLASHKRWHGPRPIKSEDYSAFGSSVNKKWSSSKSQKTASVSPQGSGTRESSTTPSEVKPDTFSPPAIQLFSENFLNLATAIKTEAVDDSEKELQVDI